MKVSIRADSVLIEGYVNAIERNSKPLLSRIGRFIERICKGAFSNALKRNDDVHVLLNHDWDRDLGSTKQGNLELVEDNIGLHARAVITDKDVIESARNGNLVGWSFGFEDTPDGVERSVDSDTGFPLRVVRDMNLYEVSILDRSKVPAYDGTLIMARSEDDIQFHGEAFLDEIQIREETVDEEIRNEEQPQQDEHPEAIETIDYSIYEEMIAEMKGV
jgi:HK97 family phage prohead protease